MSYTIGTGDKLANVTVMDVEVKCMFETKNIFSPALTTLNMRGKYVENPTLSLDGGAFNHTGNCKVGLRNASSASEGVVLDRVVSIGVPFCPEDFDCEKLWR